MEFEFENSQHIWLWVQNKAAYELIETNPYYFLLSFATEILARQIKMHLIYAYRAIKYET